MPICPAIVYIRCNPPSHNNGKTHLCRSLGRVPFFPNSPGAACGRGEIFRDRHQTRSSCPGPSPSLNITSHLEQPTPDKTCNLMTMSVLLIHQSPVLPEVDSVMLREVDGSGRTRTTFTGTGWPRLEPPDPPLPDSSSSAQKALYFLGPYFNSHTYLASMV